MKLADRVADTLVGERLVRRNPLLYPRARALFDRLESSPLAERRQYTDRRLRVVLAAAAATRYGRSVGAGTELRRWPLLAKAAVHEDPGAFTRPRALVVAHASTSGTTGAPLRLPRSASSIAVQQAAIDRLARDRGIDLATARVAVLRGDDVGRPGSGLPCWKDVARGRRRIFSSNDLGPETVGAFGDALEEFAPSALLAYPTVLESLCNLLDREGRRLTIPLTLTSSEVLPSAARHLAEATLATEVVDYYGQAERVTFAYSFRDGEYLFLPGYGFTELLPAGGDGGDVLYEIVGTSLWNLAMPLVRYRTGDLVRVRTKLEPQELAAISYGLRPIHGVLGRSGDFLISPLGVKLMGIDHIPRDVDNIVRLQFIQERRDFVRILVLAKRAFRADDQRQIATNAERKLPAEMTYSIEVVDTLERTLQDKTPFVIRRAGVEAAAS